MITTLRRDGVRDEAREQAYGMTREQESPSDGDPYPQYGVDQVGVTLTQRR
jgi:hypothetical protein